MSSTVYEEEKSLIHECVDGGSVPWQRFVDRYGRLIASVACAVCSSWSRPACEADDLVGHVYEKLLEDRCRRLRLWRQQSKFSTYLVQVARNLCHDYLDRHGKAIPVTENQDPGQWFTGQNAGDVPECEETTNLEARKVALRDALARLSPKQAMILRLRMEGLSLRRIAALMKIPVGTVSAENSRAIDRLRAALGDLRDNAQERSKER